MPLQSTSGAASYDAFGGGVAAVPKYIEDYFSTFVYTGNNSTNAINNGIDLSTKGGLIWTKGRSAGLAGVNHWLSDTARGIGYSLASDSTAAQAGPYSFITLGTGGYSLNTTAVGLNTSGETYASWSWAKAPKFFDVVTWTGTGGVRTLTHNLGSTPGSIFVKKIIGAPQSWAVYHRSLGATKGLALDLTNAADVYSGYWNNTEPTATQFTVGNPFNMAQVDDPGATYVAYLFAHDAGGFGLTGTDNVISCGSYTGNGSTDGPVINLGYEPQWLLIKSSSASSTAWTLIDNMRGMTVGGADAYLKPNSSDAETTSLDLLSPTATGFKLTSTLGLVNGANDYIYIAIRRGPMKVPTSGTSVFSPAVQTPAGFPTYTVLNSSSGFPVDMLIYKARNNVETPYLTNRLTNNYLQTASTAAEASYTYGYDLMQGVNGQFSGTPQVSYAMRRAPSFFDEVCYTGTGTGGTQITHNLGVAPTLVIVKWRTGAVGESWAVMCTEASSSPDRRFLYLDLNAAGGGLNSHFSNASGTPVLPTSTVFTVGNNSDTNKSAATYVAYLFATCAGVSKVGSYTGTGALQTINCGFTSGARFVLIKRTDSTGNWWTYDSARGISSGNDPYLYLNTTAAEVTGTNYVDTDSTGFKVTAAAPAELNASGGTYIFLAIA